MRFIKRASAAALVVLCLSANFVALAIEPNEIIKEQPEKLQTIQKVYVLPKLQNPDVIPKDGFTEDKTEYEFTEIIIEDNSEEAVKNHTETVSIHTDTSNTKQVISKFEPVMDISTEDGYTGKLELDYTTLNVSAAGYGTQSYTITESRSYPGLSDADTSLVPKTINKDGNVLNLTNISWRSSANDNIDGQDFAVRYTADAVYSGKGTKTYAKGYTATAEYKGEIKKVSNDTVTYTVLFTEVPNGHLASYWWAYLLGLGALGGGGYGAYRLIRKRRVGY